MVALSVAIQLVAPPALLPAAARAWAVSVLRLGTLLSRRFQPQEVSFTDVWEKHVMPHVVGRGSGSAAWRAAAA